MVWRERLPRALNLAWAEIVLALVIGAGLSYYFEPKGTFEIFHHIGIGLIVAAAVTTFWQFREFEEFFATFSRKILVEDAYLEKLKVPSLTRLRSRAGHAILKEYVTNSRYERESLGDWLDEHIYGRLLPGQSPGSGLYRENYNETICLEHLTRADALREVKASLTEVPEEAQQRLVLKVTSVTTYCVVAPRLRDRRYSHYDVKYSGNSATMRNFPVTKRISVRVGYDKKSAVGCDMQISDPPEGGIVYDAKPVHLKFDRKTGACQVWIEATEYRDTDREPYALGTMGLLTKNLTVQVYQAGIGPKLTFDGGVMATGDKETPAHAPNSYTLRYSGWLFEDHGYYIWWWYK